MTQYYNDLLRGLGTGVSVAVTDAGSTKLAALAKHQVYIISTTAANGVHVKVGPQASVAAAVTDHLLTPDAPIEVETTATNNAVAGIVPSGGAAGVLTATPRRT
ncbi:hypothetical protein KJ925_04815 [Patescibacteria group bacterium]|nr:hypothetical protein [Patescibacteria group bacterium]